MIYLSIFLVVLLLFGLIFRGISMAKTARIQELEAKKQDIISKYEFLREHKRELTSELAQKEQQLATLHNSGEGIKILSAKEMNIDSSVDSPDEKISRYLLQKGTINLEQSEKVRLKMETLHMDFLGTCLTLGYIDLKTAKAALKANNLKNKLNQ